MYVALGIISLTRVLSVTTVSSTCNGNSTTDPRIAMKKNNTDKKNNGISVLYPCHNKSFRLYNLPVSLHVMTPTMTIPKNSQTTG